MSRTETLLEIDVDKELQKIIQRLNSLPDQIAAPNILKNALNATARKVRKQLVKDAKGQYAIKDTGILKDEKQGAPKVLTATAASMSATIRSKGPMQEIMTFMTRPNQGTGAAAAQILASGSMKPLEMSGLKAFIATFVNENSKGERTEHTAIVQRRGKERLPLKKLMSPAVPHMLGNETVRGQAAALAYETLQSEIDKQIQKVLGKA